MAKIFELFPVPPTVNKILHPVNIEENNFDRIKYYSEKSGLSIEYIVNHIIENVLINIKSIPTSKNNGK